MVGLCANDKTQEGKNKPTLHHAASIGQTKFVVLVIAIRPVGTAESTEMIQRNAFIRPPQIWKNHCWLFNRKLGVENVS